MAPFAGSPASSHAAAIIDGAAIAAALTREVAAAAATLRAAGVRPGLAVVLVGNDPASEIYVGSKGRAAEALAFHSVQHTKPATTTEAELLALVDALNRDPAIHGILVQMPLPAHIDARRVIAAIRPEKDVDGLHPLNVGRLSIGDVGAALVPCTPAGCMILLRHVLGRDLAGRHAVVVGRSNLVGKPIAKLLLHADCTVSIAHSKTRDLPGLVRQGDIVIAAAGRPELVRGAWIKPGATVIDVGVNRIAAPERGPGKTRIVGDVAFAEVAAVAARISPVPKGVGPMTIAMLMANTVTAAYRQSGRRAPAF